MDDAARDFAAFYERSRGICFRAVLASVGDPHEAEEAVAEAFARAWRHWRTVHRHPAPAAWVVRTALNAHVSWWRRRRREVACDTLRPAGRAEDIDAVAVDCVLLAALRALPRRQREVIVLRVFLDLDTRATAAALGIAPDTVRVHLHRATKALRTQLHAASEQEVTS